MDSGTIQHLWAELRLLATDGIHAITAGSIMDWTYRKSIRLDVRKMKFEHIYLLNKKPDDSSGFCHFLFIPRMISFTSAPTRVDSVIFCNALLYVNKSNE